jgi:acetyl esterase/lipase
MPQTIPLWPQNTPHAKGTASGDTPTLDIYEPFGKAFHDTAILILPGGGYGALSAQEGEGFAGVFQLHGFKAFVLNYRLGSNGYRHPVMLMDAARALRLVRSRAATDGFDPGKIVIVGSSAGGHLAATLLTGWDTGNPSDPDPVERESSRPDFGILCYPVISMITQPHAGSLKNLLGDAPGEELLVKTSSERQVRPGLPPVFLWQTNEDKVVSVEHSLLYAAALREHGIPHELHIYQHGKHGTGLIGTEHPWFGDLLFWLRAHGFVAGKTEANPR